MTGNPKTVFLSLLVLFILLFIFVVSIKSVDQDRRRKTREDRRFMVRISAWFGSGWLEILFLVAAVIINRFWAALAGNIAGGFLILAIIAVAFRIIIRLKQYTSLDSIWSRLTVMTGFTPFAVIAVISVFHILALIRLEVWPTKSFEEKVDPFICGAEKIYDRGDWPSWMYRLLHEGFFKGTYQPKLFDTSHKFESFDATFFHIGSVGVTNYRLVGQTYPAAANSDTMYFLFQGEKRKKKTRQSVAIMDNFRGTISKPKPQPVRIGGTQANLAKALVDNEFDINRVICHSDAMATGIMEPDGFVFDMSYIGHPPDNSQVVLVTDHSVYKPKIVRMEPGTSFFDWLLARPKYVATDQVVTMEPIDNRSVREEYRGHIEHYVRMAAGKNEVVQQVGLPFVYGGQIQNAGSGDVFLVHYLLE